ncbi:hypothetical protein GCM10027287_09780 [Bordetella muralis]
MSGIAGCCESPGGSSFSASWLGAEVYSGSAERPLYPHRFQTPSNRSAQGPDGVLLLVTLKYLRSFAVCQ